MPLVPVAAARSETERGHAAELTQRARKILPRHARGEPQRVAVVRNLAEGELLQGILLEEGIPSILRRSGGFDVPDMLAAGPRDVMVPASGVEAARRLLAVEDESPPIVVEESFGRTAFKLAAAMLVILLLFGALAGIIWALAP